MCLRSTESHYSTENHYMRIKRQVEASVGRAHGILNLGFEKKLQSY